MAKVVKRVKHFLFGRPLPSERLEHDDQIGEEVPERLEDGVAERLEESAARRVEAP
jgi:hypothetical protein